MAWNDKIRDLNLDWFLEGPIGSVLKSILGIFDNNNLEKSKTKEQEKAVYHAYLVSLFVYIAKSDGKLNSIEIKIIKNFFIKKGLKSNDLEKIKDAMKIANKTANIDIRSIIKQLNYVFEYSTRKNILELCYHIASADSIINDNELNDLEKMGNYMKISSTDQLILQMDYDFKETSYKDKEQEIEDELNRLKKENLYGYSSSNKKSQKQNFNKQERKQNFHKQKSKSNYEILEVSKDASFSEIKKAYIKMVKKHHPDHFQDAKKKANAEIKIKQINVAFRELKKIHRK